MKRIIIAIFAILVPLFATAQTDGRDYLTAFLEESLSGAGRKVTVTGFQGALSSTASLESLTIADDQGVWLTLRGVNLDWSRSSLLRGAVVVTALTAKDIELARLPTPSAAAKPEAGQFSLPDLPVSISIGKIMADHISLGPTVLGQAVEAQLQASMQLGGGEGAASLLLQRSGAGPQGKIALTVSYANRDQRLKVDLLAEEGAGGLAAVKLGLPEAPSLSLSIKGDGPLTDFTADIGLQTDQTDRLRGKVVLTGAEGGGQGFAADLSGDMAPLFLPDYAAFFGNRVTLQLAGTRAADGGLNLPQFHLSAKALQLDGALFVKSDGLPQSFALTGRIADPAGGAVLLPLTTAQQVRVGSADLKLSYNAAQGEGWAGRIAISGLVRDDFRVSTLSLDGSGRIARVAGKRQVGGSFRYSAEGLDPRDQALARALGSVIWGDALGFWREGAGNLTLGRMTVQGEDYAAKASGQITGLAGAFAISGQASAEMQDLSRLSGLAGRGLGGAADVSLTGSGSPITGAFDLQATAKGQDMRAGIAPLDSVLRGSALLRASVLRDTTGVALRALTLQAQSLTASAQGQLASAGSDVTATLNFTDLQSLGAGYRGSLSGKAHLTGTQAQAQMTLTATGQSLRLGQAQIDSLLAGPSQLALELALNAGQMQINRADLSNPQLRVTASGALDGSLQRVKLDARLANLALLLPEFPGPLTVTGTAAQDAKGTTLDLTAKGPGQIDASVKGSLAKGFDTADLTIKGQARAALANAFIAPRSVSGQLGFDLRLRGPLQLTSLSGPVTLSQGQLADPALKFSLRNISAQLGLQAGRAVVTSSLDVSSGGRIAVQGTAELRAPYAGDLTVDLQSVILRDPDLYEARLNGQLRVTGPLTGGAQIVGRIALNETELRVPSTGVSGASGLADLRHINEPVAVYATRARAGLIAQAKPSTGGGAGFGLDVVLSAPSRLFVRGRGLDAEVGGELRLTGSTNAVVPIGAFSLIRGRLDILGKRLDLTEALLQMQGTLTPYVQIAATTQNDGITSGVSIIGPASDPVVSFTSVPELPEEEVVAQLLFGRGLQTLSPFQALQLASAVATLAGRGGDGVIAKLRKGVGLDNLDVKTGADGSTQVTAGKYISEKVYSEVTVDQQGQSQINLNLDISKSIKLQAKAGSTGSTGLGVLLQKDY